MIHDLPLLLTISQLFAKPIITQTDVYPNGFIILNKASRKSKKSDKITITKSFTFSLLLLIHSFPMHPFSTPWKHQKTLRFSGGRERVHWEQWAKSGSMSQNLGTYENDSHDNEHLSLMKRRLASAKKKCDQSHKNSSWRGLRMERHNIRLFYRLRRLQGKSFVPTPSPVVKQFCIISANIKSLVHWTLPSFPAQFWQPSLLH